MKLQQEIVEPLGNRILVRPDKAETMTEQGIEIPKAAAEAPPTGEVVQVGPDVSHVKPGMRVLFYGWAGTNVECGGDELRLLNEPEIVGILSPIKKAKA